MLESGYTTSSVHDWFANHSFDSSPPTISNRQCINNSTPAGSPAIHPTSPHANLEKDNLSLTWSDLSPKMSPSMSSFSSSEDDGADDDDEEEEEVYQNNDADDCQPGNMNQLMDLNWRDRLLLQTCLDNVKHANRSIRQRAIRELCKMTDISSNLGSAIWSTPSAVQSLILELLSLYMHIQPPSISRYQVQFICSILSLLQQMVLDRHCRDEFLSSRIHFHVIPFFLFDTAGSTRDVEHLRVCLLSFFATIAQKLAGDVPALEMHLDVLDSEVLRFTIDAMEKCNSDVGRSMAVLLLHKLLQSTALVNFIAAKRRRFKDVARALASLVYSMSCKMPNAALLASLPAATFMAKEAYQRVKRVLYLLLQCYVQLTANDLLCRALAGGLPREFTTDQLCQLYPDCELKEELEKLWIRVDPTPSRILCERKHFSHLH